MTDNSDIDVLADQLMKRNLVPRDYVISRVAAADILNALTANGRAKLVRREPTKEMCEAPGYNGDPADLRPKVFSGIWEMMYAAAKPFEGE